MAAFRKYDVFYSKSIKSIEEKTFTGGVVTILSLITVLLLFVSELYIYTSIVVQNRMFVDTRPQDSRLNINVDIKFLHEPCSDVEMHVVDSKGGQAILKSKSIKKVDIENHEGCRLSGFLEVGKVAGEIRFMHDGPMNIVNIMNLLNFNSTHVVEKLSFGPNIPNIVNPLVDVHKTVLENVAIYKYFIQIVPTTYVYLNGRTVYTYQYSVTEHSKKPSHIGQPSLPGVLFAYEFSPIRVEYIETKPSIFQFITSTCAIVGGVFAVARIIDSGLYRYQNQKHD